MENKNCKKCANKDTDKCKGCIAVFLRGEQVSLPTHYTPISNKYPKYIISYELDNFDVPTVVISEVLKNGAIKVLKIASGKNGYYAIK